MATQRLVLPSQASEILDVLRKLGAQPSEFRWQQAPSFTFPDQTVSRLVHVPTGYYFQFDFHRNGGHACERSPGLSLPVETRGTGAWEYQMVYLAEWVQYLLREITTPDPWGNFFTAGDVIDQGQEQFKENTRFTAAELREADRRLEAIRAFLTTQAEDDDSRQRIESKIDYLVAAARAQGRRDWFFMALGVILSEVVSLGLNAEQVRQALQLLVHGIQLLTGG